MYHKSRIYKLKTENFAARLKQPNLVTKGETTDYVKKADFDDKLKNINKIFTSNKTNHVLFENEFKKLQTYDSSLFFWQKLLLQ